jgi:hypothetical protein
MELIVPKDVINWCNQQVDEGKELKFTWEGGGDSGWANLVVDDNNIEVVGYSDVLLEGIYEELDYGSWAGEFYASGEAIYSKEEQAFIGIDDYSEDGNEAHECNIVFRIPEHLWYDSIQIRIECNDGDNVDDETVSVRFIIKNGFITDEHVSLATLLEKQLLEEIREEVKVFEEYNEFRSIWQSNSFNIEDGEKVPGFIQHKITSINMGTLTTDEKSICLQLIQQDEQD